jgi:putative oxidoreductase
MKSRARYSTALSTPFPAHAEQARTLNAPRVRTVRSTLSFLQPADSTLRLVLRVAAMIAFVTLGQMKFFDSILLGTDAVVLPQGPEGFAQYLAAIGVPFPLLNAYMVCILEMICGVGLVATAFMPKPSILTRLAALPLFIDMMVATITVGVPNLMGNPVMLDGVAVTNQIWRFPLEFSLLAITLMLVVRPLARRREPAVVTVASA